MLDGILERLGTDYLDILHINWPERYIPLYGAPRYDYECERKVEETVTIAEQITIMNELIKAGKIRHYGLSNETPYGLTAFITTAKFMNLQGPCTVQNAYNLLDRNDFETGLLESVSPTNSNVAVLAYSPLAGGALTGKYKRSIKKKGLVGEDGWRFSEYIGFQHRYIADPAIEALDAYQKIADNLSLPLGPLSLAFVTSRRFTTSTVLGVTSVHQLKENVQSLNIQINEEIESLFNAVYDQHRDPTKGVFEVYDPKSEYIDPTKLPWGAKDVDVDPELDILINERLAKF
jgi:aryl-alcohol dehydrogenase-like predicted oxidoreductase